MQDIGTAKVFLRISPEKDPANKPLRSYGDGEVLTLMSVFVSVFVEAAGDSLIIVVLVSFFSLGGFVTVVSFCSHAASNTAPIKKQIYLFM
jgi:hypothetical protein